MIGPQVMEKLRAIELVAMDVDGVLTDGRTFYGPGGSEGLFFSVQDGSGIKWLHRAGVATALITGRQLEAVAARAHTLGIEDVFQGVKVKADAYAQLKERARLDDSQILYVGDDLPDLPVMRMAGVSVAVANARPEVREGALIVTSAAGGDGAVREVAELVLKAKGLWDDLLNRYLR